MRYWVTIMSLTLCRLLSGAGLHAQDRLYHHEFPLGDVVLLDGPFRHARDLNIKVLLEYDVDRLLAPYRKEAGLPEKAKGFSNWEGLDGHVGGHYLTALAMNYAATRNEECRQRMEYMIAELRACQEANTKNHVEWGKGYVGGVPHSAAIWSALKIGDLRPYRSAWVPWYNVHKMYAGLRDAWLYTGNLEAKKIFLQFCDWEIYITEGLNEEQMQSMLDTEHGGMNEVLADAYQITGDSKYLRAAKRFSHHVLLDAMTKGVDNLDNKHANTQVPKAIGFERIGDLSGDSVFDRAAEFFWTTVTQHRSLAFGGNSRREFFPSAAASTDFINDVEGPESCNTYNMLKLTEDLFGSDPSARYMDFYERALFNHILSTQNPENGGYVYFTPARPRHYRVYSAPNEAMWCCVGSGMENHGKYNELIYSHRHDSLYLNLFIASELNWRERGIQFRQETKFPFEEKTVFRVIDGSSRFTLMLRYPSWVKKGALTVLINGKRQEVAGNPGSYIALLRDWKKGDKLEVSLPMQNTIEPLPHVPSYVAILHGPIVLAAKTGTQDLAGLIADDGRWAHIPHGERLPVDQAPIIISDHKTDITDGLVPVKDQPLHFTFSHVKWVNPEPLVLEPFFEIHNARYMMYWMALSGNQYQTYLDSIATEEKAKLALEKRTVDFVAPGEQQPEADHLMEKQSSRTGNNQDQFWRDAANEGFFSYQLSTNGEANLSLIVRYWGAEWGGRKFDIYIDGEKLSMEDNTGRWNQSKWFDIAYTIPAKMLAGKDVIRVKFQALPGNTAGAVYYVRLVRKPDATK